MFRILILILISTHAIGQVYYSIESGVIDNAISIRYIDDKSFATYKNKYAFYADLMLGYQYKKFYVETKVITTFNHSHSVYFKPELVKYDLRFYYKHKKIKIGYEHSCTHPIYTVKEDLQKAFLRGSYDKIFIKYSFRNAD